MRVLVADALVDKVLAVVHYCFRGPWFWWVGRFVGLRAGKSSRIGRVGGLMRCFLALLAMMVVLVLCPC